MRKLPNRQLERGEIRIEDIKLNLKSRDDVPALLFGLQYLYSQKALRDRLFAIMNEYIRPGVSKKGGTSGHGDVEHSGNGCGQARPGLQL